MTALEEIKPEYKGLHQESAGQPARHLYVAVYGEEYFFMLADEIITLDKAKEGLTKTIRGYIN